MTKFKLDLHTHTSDFFHFIFSKTDEKDYLVGLLKKLFKKGDNVVIGLAEFNSDGRFSKFLKATKKLPKDYCVSENGPIISIEKGKKKIYFVRADEIATDKGHILIVGNNGKIKTRNIEELLRNARRHGWIVVADHPLHKFFLPYFIISKLIDGWSNISLGKEDMLKNKKDFDSLEINSYFANDENEIKKIGRKNKIPIISDSDAHSIEEFFNSYFELENLDLKNISKFKKSFRKALKKHIKLHIGKHDFFAEYRHGFKVLFDYIGKKLGFVKDSY